jgi:hypothetical protein
MHFGASVQYGDWTGEAMADNIDSPTHDIRKRMEASGLWRSDDFIIGLTLWVGENSSGKSKPPVVTVFTIPVANFKQAEAYLKGRKPVKVRETRLPLSFDDFFALFKRFSIALGKRDLSMMKLSYKTVKT